MLPLETITLALQAYIASINLITLVLQDQPPEERRKAWERWFAFWDRVSQAIKL